MKSEVVVKNTTLFGSESLRTVKCVV